MHISPLCPLFYSIKPLNSVYIRGVLTSKRRGQIALKDLWFKKVELSESLRIVQDVDFLRNTPSVVAKAMQLRRCVWGVCVECVGCVLCVCGGACGGGHLCEGYVCVFLGCV